MVSNSSINTIFTLFGIISLLSLLIVFLVYCFMPDFKTLHGRIVLSNVVSITFLTLFLLLVFNVHFYQTSIFCKIIGYFGYFSSMTMFLWMSIMCWDLYSSFSKASVLSAPGHYHRRFIIYSAVGWGLSFILALLLCLLEFLLPLDSDFHAGFGVVTCFISPAGNKLLFLFHIPILIMLIFNIYSFVRIVFNLTRAHRNTEQARASRRSITSRTSKGEEFTIGYFLVLGNQISLDDNCVFLSDNCLLASSK